MVIFIYVGFLPQWLIHGNNQTYVEILVFCLVPLGPPVHFDVKTILGVGMRLAKKDLYQVLLGGYLSQRWLVESKGIM